MNKIGASFHRSSSVNKTFAHSSKEKRLAGKSPEILMERGSSRTKETPNTELCGRAGHDKKAN